MEIPINTPVPCSTRCAGARWRETHLEQVVEVAALSHVEWSDKGREEEGVCDMNRGENEQRGEWLV